MQTVFLASLTIVLEFHKFAAAVSMMLSIKYYMISIVLSTILRRFTFQCQMEINEVVRYQYTTMTIFVRLKAATNMPKG